MSRRKKVKPEDQWSCKRSTDILASYTKFQTGFSQKLLCQPEQTLYESFQVQGNENLVTRYWSHDKDGRLAPMW